MENLQVRADLHWRLGRCLGHKAPSTSTASCVPGFRRECGLYAAAQSPRVEDICRRESLFFISRPPKFAATCERAPYASSATQSPVPMLYFSLALNAVLVVTLVAVCRPRANLIVASIALRQQLATLRTNQLDYVGVTPSESRDIQTEETPPLAPTVHRRV